MIIAVGSVNPTKIRPVATIFTHYFSEIDVTGVAVDSGVSKQPMSYDEMYGGAFNRAHNALKKVEGADFGVGIEAGFQKYSFGWLENALVIVADRKGDIGIGATAGVVVPESIIQEIKKGKELDEVIDSLFATSNVGNSIGMFGLLTKEVVTRSDAIEQAVAFALSRFLHPTLFSK